MSFWKTLGQSIAKSAGDAVSPLVSGGLSILGGVIGADRTHQENKYWANYNSPAEQMKRLSDAGLNPNLVYGNGASATFAPQGDPGAEMQQGVSQAGSRAMQSYYQSQQLKNEQKVADSQANKNNADANLSNVKAQTEGIMQGIYSSPDYQRQFGVRNAVGESQVQKNASEIALNATKEDYTRAATSLAKLNSAHQIIENEILDQFGRKSAEAQSVRATYEAEMSRIESNNFENLVALEIATKQQGLRLTEAQISNLYSAIVLNSALTSKAYADAQLSTQQASSESDRRYMMREAGNQSHYNAVSQTLRNYYLKQGISIDNYSISMSGKLDVGGYGLKAGAGASYSEKGRVGAIPIWAR